MSVLPFSQALRERTWSSHADSEGAGFMSDLMKGVGTREDYIALVEQHYFMYEALEGAEKVFADDPVVGLFATSRLTRLPALEADLAHLVGDDWRTRIVALPATAAYAERIRQVAAEGWAGGFVAHHYTRYLGDLSGGQIIKRMLERHYGLSGDGLAFYTFVEIPKSKPFKDVYRERLDALVLTPEQLDETVAEAKHAFRLNSDLFADLGAAHP